MKEKIWVLGAGGMLGASMMRTLQQRKIEAKGTTRKEIDITSSKELRDFFAKEQFTHIINCAAYTDVDFAEKERKEAFAINVIGVRNIAQVAHEGGAKVIHFSTDYVFDGKKHSPYREDDSPHPCNYYGQTKFEGERILRERCPDSCIIRTSWLFGQGKMHFVNKMVEQMKQRRQVCVVYDKWGRMTAAKDLAEVVVSMLPHSGIFHFANRERTNWYEITRYLDEHAKQKGWDLLCQQIFPVPKERFRAVASRPYNSVLDTTKIEQLLQIKPRTWKEALQEFLEEEFSISNP